MKIYIYALISAIFLFVAHILGSLYDLYHLIFQYDVPMHIIGGLTIGFFVIAVLSSCKISFIYECKHRYAMIIALVFMAGFIWELFEAYYNIAGAPVGTKAYYIDTIKDLCDDVIGGAIALYISGKKDSKKREDKN